MGCSIGHYFVGSLAYGDYLIVIAPPGKALQIMINICKGYASDYEGIIKVQKVSVWFLKANNVKLLNFRLLWIMRG